MAGEGMVVNPLLKVGRLVAMLAASSGGLSLPDTKLTLYDPADSTKAIRFDAGNVTAGQTRVLTAPDASIIIAGSAAALTSGRVPYVTTGGLLTDSAGLTFSTGTNEELFVGDGSGEATVYLNGGAGSTRNFRFRTNGTNRWSFYVSSTAESGSDAGSNFSIRAFTDDGSTIDDPLSIARAAGGAITITRPFVAAINNGALINADFTDTAASRTVAILRINTSATAHTSAALLDVVSSASTSSDKMFRVRSNSTDRVTVAADGSVVLSGTLSTGAVTMTGATIVRSSSTSALQISGDTSVSSGANIALYSAAHATFALLGKLRSNSSDVLTWTTSVVTVTPTTASTSTTTGSLVNAGGFGNAGAAYFGGAVTCASTLTMANNQAIRWADSGATNRRTFLVSSSDTFFVGPIDTGWAAETNLNAGTSMRLRVHGAAGSFVDSIVIVNGTASTAYVSIPLTTDGALTVAGKITAKVAVPGSFADLAAVQTYLASILT